MRALSQSPGIPFLAETLAQKLEAIQSRLMSEFRHHNDRAALWEGGAEPNVELMLAEAEIMAESLSRAAHLLRHVAEGEQV